MYKGLFKEDFKRMDFFWVSWFYEVGQLTTVAYKTWKVLYAAYAKRVQREINDWNQSYVSS